MQKTIFTTCMFILVGVSCCEKPVTAADPDQVRRWIREVDRGVQVIGERGQLEPWPHLQLYARDGSVKVSEADGLKLAYAVRGQLAIVVKTLHEETPLRQAQISKRYLAAANQLGQSGGYVNLVLAESLRRILIAYTANSLIREPGRIDLLGGLADSLAKPLYEKQAFGKVLAEEIGETDAEKRLIKAVENGNEALGFNEAIRIAGADPARLVKDIRYYLKEPATTELLHQRDLPLFLRRVFFSDRAAVSLYVMAVFVRKRGDLNRLFQEDSQYFEQVIGALRVPLPYTVFELTYANWDVALGLKMFSDDAEICGADFCQAAVQ